MSNTTLIIGNILGSILQPLYFCLFVLKVKNLKENKHILFILCFADYVLIQNFIKFTSGINADFIYSILFYVNLKVIYQNKIRITDYITYIISNVILGIINVISYFVFGMNIIGLISALAIPVLIVVILKDKLILIERFYNKFWNRSKVKTKVKSITVRGFSSAITIFLFVTLHFWILYLLFR